MSKGVDLGAIQGVTAWGWREKTVLAITIIVVAVLTAGCFAYEPLKKFVAQKVPVAALLIGYVAIFFLSGLIFYRLGNRNGGKETLEAATKAYDALIAKKDQDHQVEEDALAGALEKKGGAS